MKYWPLSVPFSLPHRFVQGRTAESEPFARSMRTGFTFRRQLSKGNSNFLDIEALVKTKVANGAAALYFVLTRLRSDSWVWTGRAELLLAFAQKLFF
jgi:hypothetical protein